MLATKLHDELMEIFYIVPGGGQAAGEELLSRQFNEQWQRKQEFQKLKGKSIATVYNPGRCCGRETSQSRCYLSMWIILAESNMKLSS